MKVVLADDEPIIVMNLKEILEDSGYQIVGTASNGFAAIDLCKEQKPDILIIDIRMPGLDGLRTAKFIHEAGYVETIVIESAFDDEEFVQKASQYGVSAFMVKPIDSKTLVSTLKVATARSKELSSLRSEVIEVNKNMETRKKIERAKGLIMEKLKLSEQEAYDYVRGISKENSISMEFVAEIILSSGFDEK
ncbi:MAG: response regulator [Emergencia sp.]|nr:response regulator [Emergencia sp.]